MNPRTRFFRDFDGNRVAYATHGEGPRVVCPAWWISHVEKDWDHDGFRQFFTTLADGLQIVRYDRPGVGLSDRTVSERTQEDDVALLAALMQELGGEPCSMLAISCGGPIAVTYAAMHPDRVERICFYGSFAKGAQICDLEVQKAVHAVVKANWGLGSRAMADIFMPDEPREETDWFARQQRDSADVDSAARLLGLTYQMDAVESLPKVRAESLVIHRRGDRAIPVECGRQLAAEISDATLVTLEGRSHPPWVRGEEIARLANAFLRGEEAEATGKRVPATDSSPFDVANRQLIVAGESVALTPLEFGVLSSLTSSTDRVVTREELLRDVWQQSFEGSNKVDAVVRTLRKKLGPFAASIETVIGHGYRFRRWISD